jgi:hypothetical protein
MATTTYVPGSLLDTSISAVMDGLDKLDAFQQKYSDKLMADLDLLKGIKIQNVPQPPQLNAPNSEMMPKLDLGGQPRFDLPGDVSFDSPPQPGNIDSLLDGLDWAIGSLGDAPQPLALNLPAAPSIGVGAPPARPPIDTSVDIPGAPALAFPDMDTLEQIALPVFSFPELPTFDATPPDPSGIKVPEVFINWTEPQYKSELLDELIARVRWMMAGGTGLPPAIEDALFARARQRLSQDARRLEQQAMDTWAARGFSMPPGMLQAQLDEARREERLKSAELDRDILVQAATWEIENLRFAVQQGVALEQLCQNLYENTVKRLFEVARFQAESQIGLFNAQVGLFNAHNSAFQTLAMVYRTKLDGTLARLTAYKTAVDAQVALGQVNEMKVRVYQARMEGVRTNVEVYKAMMQGAQLKADTIRTQLEAYRTDLQAYSEGLAGEKLKLDVYTSQLQGENTKAGVFDTMTRAYAATVQAVSARADISAKKAQIRLEQARMQVAQYGAHLDGWRAGMTARLQSLQYNTTAFTTNVDAWRAKVQAETAQFEATSRWTDMTSRTNIAYAEMQIKEYDTKCHNAIAEANVALEAAKAMGGYSAQLAAGAMSAAHVGAEIGAKAQISEDYPHVPRA